MKLILLSNESQFILLDGSLLEKRYSERLSSALKRFAIWLLLALVSIFIPVAHFVLVPSFFIVAFVSFFQSYKMKKKLSLNGEYNCTQCNKTLNLQKELASDFRFTCDQCFQKYKLVP